ncbi:MAG: hypothetical protein ACO2XQ_08565 [Flavobacteriales bacterium]
MRSITHLPSFLIVFIACTLLLTSCRVQQSSWWSSVEISDYLPHEANSVPLDAQNHHVGGAKSMAQEIGNPAEHILKEPLNQIESQREIASINTGPKLAISRKESLTANRLEDALELKHKLGNHPAIVPLATLQLDSLEEDAAKALAHSTSSNEDDLVKWRRKAKRKATIRYVLALGLIVTALGLIVTGLIAGWIIFFFLALSQIFSGLKWSSIAHNDARILQWKESAEKRWTRTPGQWVMAIFTWLIAIPLSILAFVGFLARDF